MSDSPSNESTLLREIASIPVLCRKCKRTMELPRKDAPDVPGWVARIEHDKCDRCDDGDRSAEHWLAADGSEPDPALRTQLIAEASNGRS